MIGFNFNIVCTRVGWKFIGWLKELCHSNETWLALNSTFPGINCIVSFQINPHWISKSGLWQDVVLSHFKRSGKLTKGVLFHQDNAPACKSVTAMATVRDCGFDLVDHPPYYFPDLAPSDYFLFTNMKKNTWLGNSIGPMMKSYLQLRTGWALLYRGNPSGATVLFDSYRVLIHQSWVESSGNVDKCLAGKDNKSVKK